MDQLDEHAPEQRELAKIAGQMVRVVMESGPRCGGCGHPRLEERGSTRILKRPGSFRTWTFLECSGCGHGCPHSGVEKKPVADELWRTVVDSDNGYETRTP